MDEAAYLGVVAVGGVVAAVAGALEYVDHQGGQALQHGCPGGCVGGRDGRCAGLANQLPQADSDRLTEVHGGVAEIVVLLHGDSEQCATVAQFVIAEAGLFGAEEQGDTRRNARLGIRLGCCGRVCWICGLRCGL